MCQDSSLCLFKYNLVLRNKVWCLCWPHPHFCTKVWVLCPMTAAIKISLIWDILEPLLNLLATLATILLLDYWLLTRYLVRRKPLIPSYIGRWWWAQRCKTHVCTAHWTPNHRRGPCHEGTTWRRWHQRTTGVGSQIRGPSLTCLVSLAVRLSFPFL